MDISRKTLRDRPNNIFHVHNYRTNYARNDTINRICKKGNEVVDEWSFFEKSINKFHTHLELLVHNYQNELTNQICYNII